MGVTAPRYVSPKERAENRARLIRFGYGVALAIPVALALILFGWRRDGCASSPSAWTPHSASRSCG